MNEDKVKKQFGNTVKSIRLEKKLSQEALAELTGLHRTYISDVERGDRNISLINIIKLCAALDIVPSYLFSKIEGEE